MSIRLSLILLTVLLAPMAWARAGDTLVLNTGVRAPYTMPDRSEIGRAHV